MSRNEKSAGVSKGYCYSTHEAQRCYQCMCYEQLRDSSRIGAEISVYRTTSKRSSAGLDIPKLVSDGQKKNTIMDTRSLLC